MILDLFLIWLMDCNMRCQGYFFFNFYWRFFCSFYSFNCCNLSSIFSWLTTYSHKNQIMNKLNNNSMKRKSDQTKAPLMECFRKPKKNKTFNSIAYSHLPSLQQNPIIPETITHSILEKILQKVFHEIQLRTEVAFFNNIINKCEMLIVSLTDCSDPLIEIKREEFRVPENQPLTNVKDPLNGFNKMIVSKRSQRQGQNSYLKSEVDSSVYQLENVKERNLRKSQKKLVPLERNLSINQCEEQKIDDYLRRKLLKFEGLQKNKDLISNGIKNQKNIKASSLTIKKYSSSKTNYRKPQLIQPLLVIDNIKLKNRYRTQQHSLIQHKLVAQSFNNQHVEKPQYKSNRSIIKTLKKTNNRQLIRNQQSNN